jgi:hypothetical protein
MRRVLSAVLVACAPFSAAMAQRAEYAVKIVCGPPDHPAVANGYYYTAINVHNPSRESAKFRWKIALTLPRIQPGPITTFFNASLKPDQALEIECSDIRERAPKLPFFKGFVVIESDTEFDVVGVYTAAQSPDGRVAALEIERVPVRRSTQ